jgi:hypothetical protein
VGNKKLGKLMTKYNVVKIMKGEIMYLGNGDAWMTSPAGAKEFCEETAQKIAFNYNRHFCDLGGEHYNYIRVKAS